MNKNSKNAAENFKNGYNCAQSVLLTFEDKIGLDKETILRLSSSFGGGMGRLREVCGAVSAMFMVAGLLVGYDSPNDDAAKAKHYELIQNLASEFKKRHGTIICRELLNLSGLNNQSEGEMFSPRPQKRNEEYYKARPCEEFVKTAAEIIEKTLLK